MVQLAIFLLAIGIILLAIELLIPGFGVFGISSIIALVSAFGIIITKVQYGIYIVTGVIILLAIALKSLFDYIKRRQLYGKLILDETLNTDIKDVDGLEYFIGKEGTTKTALKPFGRADINNVLLDVCSESGYVKENERVKVVEVSRNKVVVKHLIQ